MFSLADVLRRYWPAYEQQFGAQILPSHTRAVRAILACRTAQLGGEIYRCARCRQDRYVYHSCNHRACPRCGHAEATEWLQRQQRKLLPVPYYLITFTVPADLRPWLRSHQQAGYAALLQASAATLQDVARRPKYLGAELGILSVLHTWGRQLQFHPHVHCVVPAGGLRADGLRWCRPPSPDFFLPQRVLAARFRTRLRDALAAAADAATIPAAVWRQKWVVDVQPVGSGASALKYLSAYVYRTALGSRRLLADADQHVSFEYKDSGDGTLHTLRLPAGEFIRRFLQHVLPRGFQRVRYYGWLSPAAKVRWQRILGWLAHPAAPLEPPAPKPPRCCSHCGEPLYRIGRFVRAP
jgi:hypothetical protein